MTLCVSSFEGPQELTLQESKKSERGKKVPKSGLTKLVLVTQRLLRKKNLSVNGAQSKVAGNIFCGCIFKTKSAYTVNRKALKC